MIDGFNQLTMVLEQEKGNLFIQNCEPDAELYLDGMRIGTVGSGLVRDVDAGRRTIEIRVPGRKAVHEVEIIKDSTVRLVPEFEGNPYTVSFDSQGGSEPNPRSKSVVYGQRYGDLPNVTRDGYEFAGWWTEPDGRGKEVLSTTIATMRGYQTLYASWKGRGVGDIGPSGGYIFYDKGSYSNGWRYLEAAPAGWSGGSEYPLSIFGYHRTSENGSNMSVETGTGIGSGKENTQKLVGAMYSAAYSGSTTTTQYAAKMCAEYRGGGHDDWFLPSKDELNLMYQNLKRNNLGGFSDNYWSSSELNAYDAWYQSFTSGLQNVYYRYFEFSVRPVRAF